MELSTINKSTGVIVLDSVLDEESEGFLNQHLQDAANKGLNRVILDFRPVDLMNTLGVGNLVKLTAIAKRKGIKLLAYGLSDRYREIFTLTCLDGAVGTDGFSQEDTAYLKAMHVQTGRQSDAGWAPYRGRIQVTEKPKGAFAKNMDNRSVQAQICGFGKMWQKTFWLIIDKPDLSPGHVIKTLMQNFVSFQIPENFFYPTSKGLTPGALVFIDSFTPGGIVSTGVYVLYVDDTSFTYITPQGHPEAGWITFSAKEQDGKIRMQIQGLVRTSDPFYEIAYAIAGQALQEKIWLNVLTQVAKHFGVEDNGQMVKYKPADDLQWSRWSNIWYNAQLRCLPLNITDLWPLYQKVKAKRMHGGY
jgi:anti-anti-sigma regulatory factor